MNRRVAPDPTLTKHREEIMFFNRLIIDLKKRLLGHDYDEITMERLNEATAMIAKLERCREQVRFYR